MPMTTSRTVHHNSRKYRALRALEDTHVTNGTKPNGEAVQDVEAVNSREQIGPQFSINHTAPLLESASTKMLTKYLTAVNVTFSAFNRRSGTTARIFLAQLPPNARSTMSVNVNMLGRSASEQPASLALKFKDGKEMQLDLEKMQIKEIQAEVDRHSRVLRRQEELAG